MNSTAQFSSVYSQPRAGVVSAPTQQMVNANNPRQSGGVQSMIQGTGGRLEAVTGLELPTLIALGAIAWLLIYLD